MCITYSFSSRKRPAISLLSLSVSVCLFWRSFAFYFVNSQPFRARTISFNKNAMDPTIFPYHIAHILHYGNTDDYCFPQFYAIGFCRWNENVFMNVALKLDWIEISKKCFVNWNFSHRLRLHKNNGRRSYYNTAKIDYRLKSIILCWAKNNLIILIIAHVISCNILFLLILLLYGEATDIQDTHILKVLQMLIVSNVLCGWLAMPCTLYPKMMINILSRALVSVQTSIVYMCSCSSNNAGSLNSCMPNHIIGTIRVHVNLL